MSSSSSLPDKVLARIAVELPSLKHELSSMEHTNDRVCLLGQFSRTQATFHCWRDGEEYDRLVEDVQQQVTHDLQLLERNASWRDRMVHLSDAQQAVKVIYQQTVSLGISYGDEYLFASWLQHIDITLPTEQLYASFEQFGMLQLRELVQCDRPKLVIGCGNRTKTEGCTEDHHPNPHHGDDTVDPVLRRNPTIVGVFGAQTRGSCGSVFPDGHYQTVMDEGMGIRKAHEWTEIERILRPGGFVLLVGYPVDEPPPESSRLRIWGALETELAYSCPTPLTFKAGYRCWYKAWQHQLRVFGGVVVLAKLTDQDTLPDAFTQDDLPHGMRLVQCIRAHNQ